MSGWVPDDKSPAPGKAARMRLRPLVALLALALGISGIVGGVAQATPEAPNDATCGLHWFGEYQKPKGMRPAFVGDGLGSRDDADGPRYRLQVSGTGPYTLTVKRASDNSTLLTVQASAGNTSWGFSPDQDRFLVVEGGNGITDPVAYRLYDLTA